MIVKFYTASDIPDEYILPNTSYGRSREIFLSRSALKLALQDLTPDFKDISLNELIIENHHHLKNHPNILVSLAHTKNYAVAVISDQPNYLSIGIDLELIARNIKNGIHKYIDHSFDNKFDLLELWAIKEACFKAAWPKFNSIKNDNLVLKDIWVQNSKFGIFNSKTPIGTFDLKIIEEFDEKFIVTTAILRNI